MSAISLHQDGNNPVGQTLGTRWGRAQATFASKVQVGEGTAQVVREADVFLETFEVDLPAVISTDLRLNQANAQSVGSVSAPQRGRSPLATPTCSALRPP